MIEVQKEQRKRVERAIIVGCLTPEDSETTVLEHLEELRRLVSNLGIEVIEQIVVKLRSPLAQYYIGNGKAEEIRDTFQMLEADVLVFDMELSPSQQRNWERLTRGCVIDRQEVILDIFADRATTKEAVLQVELARLQYYLPRLTRAWTHLSRQRGGAKGTRGEGETQIETDRRLIKKRISQLQKDLIIVRRQRDTQRKSRLRNEIPHAAIVGYTNAGKSSLLNRLTEAGVIAEDKLFATLDPTTRKLILPSGRQLLVTDTVGFVRKLPHTLVEAFKSTLEEAYYADFLILVLDLSSNQLEEHWETTMQVLKELGAVDKELVVVFNKIDIANDPISRVRARNLFPNGVFLSTKTGEGIKDLEEKLLDAVSADSTLLRVKLPPSRYDLAAMAHQHGNVLESKYDEDGNLWMTFHIAENIDEKYKDYTVCAGTR